MKLVLIVSLELLTLEPKPTPKEKQLKVKHGAAAKKPLVEDTAHDSEDTIYVAQSSIVDTQYNPASQAGSQEEDSDSTTAENQDSQTTERGPARKKAKIDG